MQLLLAALTLVSPALGSPPKPASHGQLDFTPGQIWLDTDDNPIEAHAGGILSAKGIYYWYGENHRLGVGNKTGVSVYSSADLHIWKNEGVALPREALPPQFRDSGVCERPKVIYNAKTGKYVMWMHLDSDGYKTASAGVASSDSPTGPFTFLSFARPIHYDFGIEPDDRFSQKALGSTFRDMNLFVDEDGAAYVIYCSENNATTYIVRLNDSYTAPEVPSVEGKTWARALVGKFREAPAIFKNSGKYYLFSSGTTGWSPNPADLSTAPDILGPWTSLGNPAHGKGSDTTFHSQPTFVLPVPGKPGAFIYMGDRWVGDALEQSTHVWLPFVVQADGTVSLDWIERWNLAIYDNHAGRLLAPAPRVMNDSQAGPQLAWQAIAGADHYLLFRNAEQIGSTAGTSFHLPPALAGRSYAYSVVAANIRGVRSDFSRPIPVSSSPQQMVYLSDIEPDSWHHAFGPLQHDKGVDGGPIRIAGKVYRKGIGTHAASEIIYRLGGLYSTFHACAGADNAMKPEFNWKPTSVEFQVWLDGAIKFSSGVMFGDTPAKCIDIPVEGVEELKLVVTDGGDGNHYDHADWADAKLLLK